MRLSNGDSIPLPVHVVSDVGGATKLHWSLDPSLSRNLTHPRPPARTTDRCTLVDGSGNLSSSQDLIVAHERTRSIFTPNLSPYYGPAYSICPELVTAMNCIPRFVTDLRSRVDGLSRGH
jgi:hypothetical protein